MPYVAGLSGGPWQRNLSPDRGLVVALGWRLDRRRALEGGQLPQSGGVRPQLTVTVDLDSLLGRPGALGGEVGWAGPLDPEACQRLACDGAVTRVLVTRHPSGQHHHPGHDPIGGAPAQPLEVGRTTRVIQAAQRTALAVRDGVVCSPTASGRWPGARPIICATGCTAAPPIWPIWPCCAGPTIGRSMRAAGGSPAAPTVSSPPPHRTGDIPPPDDIPPPPDRRRAAPRHRAQRSRSGCGLARWAGPAATNRYPTLPRPHNSATRRLDQCCGGRAPPEASEGRFPA